jgi:hypothetical protein
MAPATHPPRVSKPFRSLVAGSILLVVVALVWTVWPEDREAAIQRHWAAREAAWARNLAAPADEHTAAFQRHQRELVRLGRVQCKVFSLDVPPGSAGYNEVVQALIARSQNRPVCIWWFDNLKTIGVTVYATPEEMPDWDRLLSRWPSAAGPFIVQPGRNTDFWH